MGLRDSCYSPVTNSLLGGNLRDLERIQTTVFPRNLHKWQQLHSQPMAVWIITNSENAFLDASYMLRVTKSQRPCNTQTLYRVIRSLRTTSSRSTFNKKRTEFIIRLKNRGYPYSCMFKPVLRNESPESFSAGEKVSLQTTDAHRRKFILPFETQSHPALPNLTYGWGNDTLKLTLAITSQRNIFKRHPYNS